MKNTLDKIDEDLIKAMGRDAREGPKIIAEKFKISSSTIRRRVAQLVKKGIMRVVGVCDPVKVGYPISAVIGFKISYKNTKFVLAELAKHPEIRWFAMTTGRFDAIALVFVTSIEELTELLFNKMGRHKGVKEIETFIGLEMVKGAHVPIFMEEEIIEE